jgi:hypothetical protein
MAEDPIEQARELGRLMAPFLTIYIATQLAATRLGALQQTHYLEEKLRREILDQCLADARYVIQVL